MLGKVLPPEKSNYHMHKIHIYIKHVIQTDLVNCSFHFQIQLNFLNIHKKEKDVLLQIQVIMLMNRNFSFNWQEYDGYYEKQGLQTVPAQNHEEGRLFGGLANKTHFFT